MDPRDQNGPNGGPIGSIATAPTEVDNITQRAWEAIYKGNKSRYKKFEEAWNLLEKQQANLVVYAHKKSNQQIQGFHHFDLLQSKSHSKYILHDKKGCEYKYLL